MSAWKVRRRRGGVLTDITNDIREGTLAIAISGAPVTSKISFETTARNSRSQRPGDEIQVLDQYDAIRFLGWVSKVTYKEAETPGDLPCYAVICSDPMDMLRSTVIRPAEVIDSDWARDLEQPPGYRKNVIAGSNDPAASLSKTPREMIAWAIQAIINYGDGQAYDYIRSESLTDAAIAADGSSLLKNPTTQAPVYNSSGVASMSNFVWNRWFPMVADGLSAWDLVNSVCTLSGLHWACYPYLSSGAGKFRIATWDAYNPPSSGFGIADGWPADQPSGRTWLRAHEISVTRDTENVLNRVIVNYQGTRDGLNRLPWVALPDSLPSGDDVRTTAESSQSTYGVRTTSISTSYATAQMARAHGRRMLMGKHRPQVTGSASVAADGLTAPGLLDDIGKRIRLRLEDHSDEITGTGPYWDAYITSIALRFEREPTFAPRWLDVEFSNDPMEPPNYTPPAFGKNKGGKTAQVADTPETTIGAPLAGYGSDAGQLVFHWRNDSGLTAPDTADAVAKDAGTITGWTIVEDTGTSSSATFDVWVKTPSSQPTVANSIVASALPTLTTSVSATGSALTGWTTTFTAGALIRAQLKTATGAKRLTLVLNYVR